MTRKKIRENLYIMLFQVNFHQADDVMEQADLYLERLDTPDATKKAKGELRERFEKVWDHLTQIDQKIEEKSKGWTVDRIGKPELSILRLAVFEILFDEEVPDGVAINEAVELAKIYGTEKSTGYVNGVLGSIAKDKEG